MNQNEAPSGTATLFSSTPRNSISMAENSKTPNLTSNILDKLSSVTDNISYTNLLPKKDNKSLKDKGTAILDCNEKSFFRESGFEKLGLFDDFSELSIDEQVITQFIIELKTLRGFIKIE